MVDKDKKIVNTEEQNVPVNPVDSDNPEESLSEHPAHTVNTTTSNNEDSARQEETTAPNVVNDTGLNDLKNPGRVEGDEMEIDKKLPE